MAKLRRMGNPRISRRKRSNKNPVETLKSGSNSKQENINIDIIRKRG